MNATATSRKAILHLYKQCLQSAKRIPSVEQRLMYFQYVQEGFRRKRDLIVDSPQALASMADAKEQLDRMNYYHSIREMKEKEEKENREHKSIASKVKDSSDERESYERENRNTQKSTARNTDTAASSENSPPSSTTETEQNEKYEIVSKWLTSALPHLHNDDHTSYVQYLIQDGFDSLVMLEEELMEDDLSFMKKAHRRALWKNKK